LEIDEESLSQEFKKWLDILFIPPLDDRVPIDYGLI